MVEVQERYVARPLSSTMNASPDCPVIKDCLLGLLGCFLCCGEEFVLSRFHDLELMLRYLFQNARRLVFAHLVGTMSVLTQLLL